MPAEPIPFTNVQESGWEALSGASPSAFNITADRAGAVRLRPGIASYSEAPDAVVDSAGVVGLYATVNGDLYAVGGRTPERPIYILKDGSARELGGGAPPFGLRGSGRPVFAETEMLLVIAGGGRALQKVVLDSMETGKLGGEAPKATHVVAHGLRLVANQTDTYPANLYFSDIAAGKITYAGHESWTYGVGDAGFLAMSSRPDPVVALGENLNEVWAWGSQTTQLLVADATSVYVPVASLGHGCVAPYSVISVDGQFAWMDDRRRLVLSDGRSVEPLSDGIQTTLNGMVRVDDCFGWRPIFGRSDLLCWTFPSDGRTFCWQKGSGWGQWQGASGGRWAPLGVSAHHLRRDTNVNVVGTTGGRVALLDEGVGTDLGAPVVAEVTTGFLNRKTTARKHCQGVTLVLRRDVGAVLTPAELTVTYRDGPGAEWEPALRVDLGTDPEPVVELNSLGVYRFRQWRFRFSGSALVLAGAGERYEVEG